AGDRGRGRVGHACGVDADSKELFDRGVADLTSRFDATVGLVRDPFLPERHSGHHSLWYAYALLASGDIALAEAIIERVLELQELREDDPHHGNFRWHAEDEAVVDLNACQFVLEALVRLPLDKLRDDLCECVLKAIRLAFVESARLDVHWTYTNIYLLDVHNRIVGGEIVGDRKVVTAGAERLAEWARRTREVGAPHEFNSPTYAAVQLNCLADVGDRATDADVRVLAIEMEERVWRHVADYWHAPTMQLSGPHSRAYRRDVVGASGFLKVVLYKLLGDERLLATTRYYEGPDAEGEMIVSGIEYHCPADAREMFRAPATQEVRETVALDPRVETTSLITPKFALGTMSRPYGVGQPPEPWPMDSACVAYWRRDEAPGYGVLYSRYRMNAKAVGEQSRREASWHDIREDGTFRSAQEGGRAIVAYGMTPRGQRPISSLRLDVRMLGVSSGDVVGDGAGRFVMSDGDVYIGIVALGVEQLGHSESVVVWQDADEAVISLVNYEGPAKVFWEYRSLAGPFWKGNVRNGFAVWVAARSEFASVAAFSTALAEASVRHDVDGSRCRTAFGDVRLDYDLREMWP
ncbi:MAG: hypothetical protein ABI559_12745, partial [Chloroflexota bacterium]